LKTRFAVCGVGGGAKQDENRRTYKTKK